jgi:sodium/hydrogen antiporter
VLILARRWVDGESYVLFPAALGLFVLGTCGAIGTDDLLACAVAGHALNWDGEFLRECERRHDEVNTCIDVLLNFGGFMYIGAVIPWSEFHDPEGTGITLGRLFGMAFMVLFLRRIPAILLSYKLMPAVVGNWKEALFMGYFGPIGIGAVFYVEHARHLIPKPGEGDEEQENLIRAIGPCIYFLVVFSIIVHGLSIPALSLIYKRVGVMPIKDDAVEIRRMSLRQAVPSNAVDADGDHFIAYNRFSRPVFDPEGLPFSRTTSMARSIAPSVRPSISHSRPPPEIRLHSEGIPSGTEMEKPRDRTIRYDV